VFAGQTYLSPTFRRTITVFSLNKCHAESNQAICTPTKALTFPHAYRDKAASFPSLTPLPPTSPFSEPAHQTQGSRGAMNGAKSLSPNSENAWSLEVCVIPPILVLSLTNRAAPNRSSLLSALAHPCSELHRPRPASQLYQDSDN